MRLHLVRHGPSKVQPDQPPATWQLDPAGYAAVAELRDSGRLPEAACWYSSPEPKALDTARRLTDADVAVVDDLREHERGRTPWFSDRDEWLAVIRRVFAEPDRPALLGWEPLSRTSARLLPAVDRILDQHPEEEVVLAGHGTAWTLLRSHLLGEPADLGWWAALRMPDHHVIEVTRPCG